jgi:hypothetical protein
LKREKLNVTQRKQNVLLREEKKITSTINPIQFSLSTKVQNKTPQVDIIYMFQYGRPETEFPQPPIDAQQTKVMDDIRERK